jgi:hypothetical protein
MGRLLFSDTATERFITQRFSEGGRIKRSRITERFTWKSWQKKYGEDALPLFLISKEKKLTVVTAGRKVKARDGETVIALVNIPPGDASAVSPPVSEG